MKWLHGSPGITYKLLANWRWVERGMIYIRAGRRTDAGPSGQAGDRRWVRLSSATISDGFVGSGSGPGLFRITQRFASNRRRFGSFSGKACVPHSHGRNERAPANRKNG